MKHAVMIKANNSGIIVVLDPVLSFEELKERVAEKFREASHFLGNATVVLCMEGRDLSEIEEKELLCVISENSDLRIACLMDRNEANEELFQKTLSEKLKELDARTGQFYKGNLRSGQVAEFDTSVIILGDVNPGAKVISRGNIVVLGALKGMAAAGMSGNRNAFVLAWKMMPTQIRIGDYIARPADSSMISGCGVGGPQIAYLDEESIYVESLDKNTLCAINF